jgi:flagellar basal body rod protein FlgC
MDPLVTARYGLLAAERRFEASAVNVANMGADDSVDLGAEMIEMIQAKEAFSANITVVKFAQDMWKSLLDLQTR